MRSPSLAAPFEHGLRLALCTCVAVLAFVALACAGGGGSSALPGLQLADASPFLVEGPQGGPFTRPTRTLQLRNTSTAPIEWAVSPGVAWLVVTPTSGTLAPGASTSVLAAIDAPAAAALDAGSYSASLRFHGPTPGAPEPTVSALLLVLSGGWTEFTASPDTRTVYVSSSTGDDARDGLSPKTAKRTIAAGKALLRHGYPDWLLLARGDTWNEALGQWITSGRSANERALVGAYGPATERPLLRTGTANGVETFQGGASPARLAHVAIVGLHFQANGYTGSGEPSGLAWLLGTDDLLVEDCKVEGYHTNVLLQGYFGRHSAVQVRRCVLVDAFSTGTAPSSHGLYVSNTDGVLIEENVIDHNGWSETVPGANPTVFRHNVYVQSGSGTCTGVVARGNLLARAASHGLQLRPGGVANDNLFVRNSIALELGGGNEPNPGGVDVTALRNTVLEGKDIDPANRRGWGIEVHNLRSGNVSENVIANNVLGQLPIALDIHGNSNGIGVFDTLFSSNVIWNWGGGVFLQGGRSVLGSIVLQANDVGEARTSEALLTHLDAASTGAITSSQNRFFSVHAQPGALFRSGGGGLTLEGWRTAVGDTGSIVWTPNYPAPDRSLGAYDATLGGPGTLEHFLAEARRQSRSFWRPEYSTSAASAWIRAGFGL
ncbi:MAG: right-handed parallel beta-helix repeat-containing protein [Planctomycetes bacterium]|nr:right-handed parallel beta-helix repeat-containing protein [Planctomycetota bacterium]